MQKSPTNKIESSQDRDENTSQNQLLCPDQHQFHFQSQLSIYQSKFSKQDKSVKSEKSSNQSHQGNEPQQKSNDKNVNDPTSSEILAEYLSKVFTQQNTKSKHSQPSLQKFQKQIEEIRLKTQEKLLANYIFQKCATFQNDIIVLSIDQSKHSEVVVIQVQCGWYKTKFFILNLSTELQQKSCLHSCAQVHGFGSFGNIYLIKNRNQNFAVKCIISNHHREGYNQLQKRSQLLISSLKQYFFIKLFSQLRIGPKIKKIFGFDMVLSQQCIEFSMQICTQLVLNTQNQQKMIENLKNMHSIQLIHRDIKPENMMWSQQFQTPVFIDFGSSTFIKQKLGYKTKTKFVGTMGYVSPEMTKVFIQKQGVVDLYFNDIYGLNKSFNSQKNQKNIKFIQDRTKENKFKSILHNYNWEILLCQMKYRLFVKQYEQFFYLWSIAQKLFYYQTEVIQEKVLEFMIELRPNSVLMKIYWSLREEVRSLQFFQQMRDIYSDETSTVMWIWTKFNFKEQKFQKQMSLCRYIDVQYKNLSTLEKDIEYILISKESVKKYFYRVLEFQNQVKNQQDLMIFCLIGAHFCSLTHDRYSSQLSQKILISNKIVFLLQNYQKYHQKKQTKKKETQINYLKPIFKCHLQEFRQIAIFFQYFIFRIWTNIPTRFQDETLKKTTSTLILLGYPFYLENARHFFIYHLFLKEYEIQEDGSKLDLQIKMKGIIKYWKTFALIRVYQRIFYNRGDTNFLLDSDQIDDIVHKSKLQEIKLMQPQKDHQIFEVNHNFYLFHRRLRDSFHKNNLILQVIPETQLSKIFSQDSRPLLKFYTDWKFNILLILNLMPHKYLTVKQITLINEQNSLMKEFESKSDFSLHFTPFLLHCKKNWNLERVIKLLRIIDNMIPYEKITQRFFIELRIFCAWKDKDVKKIKRLCNLIYEQTQVVTFQNFDNLTEIIIIFHSILMHERMRFWHNAIPKLVCIQYLFLIIDRLKEYQTYYLNRQQYYVKSDQINNFYQPSKMSVSPEKINQSNSQKKQKQILQVLQSLKNSLSLIATVIRFASMYLKFGEEQYKIKKSTQTNLVQCLSPAKHLNNILPQRLKYSLFLSKQRQKKQRQFVHSAIKKLSSPNIIFSVYYLQKQIINARIFLEIKIADYNEYQSLIEMVEDNFTHQQLTSSVPSQQNQQNSVNPSPRILSLYYISKIFANNQKNKQDYENLIRSYNTWKNNQNTFTLLFQTLLVKYLFNAYIFCQKSYAQFFDFLLCTVQFIKNFPQMFALEIFYESIQKKFSPDGINCFPFKPQNWKPIEFIDYIYERIPKLTLDTDSYISLVFYECILNSFISHKVRKRLFIFIMRSFSTLKFNARSMIDNRLYEQALNIKIIEKGWYKPGIYTSDCQLIKPQKFMVFDDDMIHRQFYYAQKTFKSYDPIPDIHIIIQKRFKLKKLRKPKWQIPNFVKKLYVKKLYRYHFIKSGYDDSQFEVDTHFDSINQLCQQMK